MPVRVVGPLLALCFSLPVAAQPSIELEDAWVRALPPTQANTAAYLTVRNSGDSALAIVTGSSPIAEKVEVHTTAEVDGMLRMQQLPQLAVPPGGAVQLQPGGTHLMLLGLSRMPAVGEEVSLCLQLASGEEVCTVAPVRKGEAGTAAHHHH